MNYYIIKTDNQVQKSFLMGQYLGKGEALEALYIMLKEFEETHQVILERSQDNDKVNVYLKTSGLFLSSKELICWFQITQIEKELKVSELTKDIKNNKSVKFSKIPPLTKD